jgi:hypothetical protein
VSEKEREKERERVRKKTLRRGGELEMAISIDRNEPFVSGQVAVRKHDIG